MLAEEGEIDELKKLVGADAKLKSEAIKADTRRSEEEGKARDIFRELTGTTAWDQMAGLKPRRDDEQRIMELANEQAAVLEDVTNCDNAVRLAREALEGRRRQASRADRTNGSGAVASRCGVHRGAGAGWNNKPKPAKARPRPKNSGSPAISRGFNRLAPGVWTDAATLRVPSPETVTRFRNEFDEAQRAIAKANGEREQIDRDMATLREQLVDTAGAEPVPTVNDLSRRASRSRWWSAPDPSPFGRPSRCDNRNGISPPAMRRVVH